MNNHQPKPDETPGNAPDRTQTAAFNRALGLANFEAAKAGTLPIFLMELRAHGNVARACVTAGTNASTLENWRKRDASLARDVQLAVQFAKSEAVDYGKWVTQ